jgi:hypothetical protein
MLGFLPMKRGTASTLRRQHRAEKIK